VTFAVRNYVIEKSETPNPECIRFFCMELSFLPQGQSMDMPNQGHAYKSPLAGILFGLDGVEGCYFADEYITITKSTTTTWEALSPLVQEAINQFAESRANILSADGEKAIGTNNNDSEPQPDDDEVILAVKELLATRIRPMLRSDGGNVRYIGMDAGTVFVLLEGACKSCPSSGATLKNGIERMLMHWIPEVVEVQEVDEEFAEDFLRENTTPSTKST
jgi:Fe-S cluster biogenesis protein NfuA